jgi:muramoyltetrapeptide carboxypeptidase LdcA involved in peptidoglycan recycling
MMFYKMGVVSFYGPALLTDFAENIAMDDYTVRDIEKFWFNTNIIKTDNTHFIKHHMNRG